MAMLSALHAAFRAERSIPRPARRPRTPVLARAGRLLARTLPAWAVLRTLLLTLAGFALIDVAAFHFGAWVGLAVTGGSLLVIEALTSSDPGSPR